MGLSSSPVLAMFWIRGPVGAGVDDVDDADEAAGVEDEGVAGFTTLFPFCRGVNEAAKVRDFWTGWTGEVVRDCGCDIFCGAVDNCRMEVDLQDKSSSEDKQARRRAKAAMSTSFQMVEGSLDCELRKGDRYSVAV
jgi:hypothetical protein